MPSASASGDKVKDVALGIAATVVSAAIPTPDTTIPTAKEEVSAVVTVGLSSTVVQVSVKLTANRIKEDSVIPWSEISIVSLGTSIAPPKVAVLVR